MAQRWDLLLQSHSDVRMAAFTTMLMFSTPYWWFADISWEVYNENDRERHFLVKYFGFFSFVRLPVFHNFIHSAPVSLLFPVSQWSQILRFLKMLDVWLFVLAVCEWGLTWGSTFQSVSKSGAQLHSKQFCVSHQLSVSMSCNVLNKYTLVSCCTLLHHVCCCWS